MQLTPEQQGIINSSGNIKINAVAGSGKTTTVIEYAKTRPKNSRILYLAFNKTVKLDAAKKFAEKGLTNVKVETAHSLAYRHIVFKHDYKVLSQSYTTSEIAELLGLQGNGEKHGEHIIANHINKFIAYFCNSDKLKVQELNYLDLISDSKAKAFVKMFYPYIVEKTRLLLSKMDKGEIEITHDFYLKKFQLSNPQLPYDYILFDEGQDASSAMLDVFFKQKAIKVIVGDTHQQIYGWRFAVNSLERADFKMYNLSTSFRFSQDIANLAMEVLKLKSQIGTYQPVPITGKGNSKEHKTKAILARTNLGLLLNAIDYVTDKKDVKHIYFEGNINSYTYADDGASLYDVLNLYNGNRRIIKDRMIKAMKDLAELEEYIDKTEDVQLGIMVEIVKTYGNGIHEILKEIKAKHVGNDEREKAEMIFSTVHRCKGMEYDTIHIVNDFINEEKLKKPNGKASPLKLNEEINLLYVAVTRTRNTIHIPEQLMPANFPASPQIKVIKIEVAEPEKPKEVTKAKAIETSTGKGRAKQAVKEKAYSVETFREKHKDAYRPWNEEQDKELTIMYCERTSINELAMHFGRTKGAIRSRIKKLELAELYS